MAKYHLSILLYLLVGTVNSIKIEVSKPQIPKIFTSTTLDAAITTAMPTGTITDESLTATTGTTSSPNEDTKLTTISKPTTTSTTKKTLPTMPTKKAQTGLKVAPTKSSTTTTTSTITTMIPTPDLNDTNIMAAALNDTNSKIDTPASQYIYCNCDFHQKFCDINCCCDHDCGSAELNVFDCHALSDQPELRDRFEDFQYTHGLPSCKVNDGWLCVFRTNIRPMTDKTPHFNLDTSKYYKWSQEIHNMDVIQNGENNFYKYAQPLQLINTETNELTHFDLPSSYKQPYCQVMEPIKHLKSLESKCLIDNTEKFQNNLWQLLNMTSSTKLLSTPRNIHDNAIDANNLENMLNIKICTKTSNNAKDLDCQYDLLSRNLTENSMEDLYVTHIDFNFLHNYTHILEAQVVLQETLIPLDSTIYWQHFRVNFIYRQAEKRIIPKPVSGVYGYLLGEPIIVSKNIAHNESDEMHLGNQILNYLHPNASTDWADYVLPIFGRRQGVCYKELSKEYAINFGINEVKQCYVRLDNIDTTKNFTAYCIHIQQKILAQLLPYNYTSFEEISDRIFISQLGKPGTNDASKWLPLQILNYEYANIIGDFNGDTQIFNCRNMLLSVAYEFHTAVYNIHGLPKQSALVHATLVAGQRHDLGFGLSEMVEVPVSMSVMFYDAQRQRNLSPSPWHGNIYVIILLILLVIKL